LHQHANPALYIKKQGFAASLPGLHTVPDSDNDCKENIPLLEKTRTIIIIWRVGKTGERMRIIAVIGGSSESRANLKEAEAVGSLIAKSGAALLCGGLKGVMEAAARGAKKEGGITIGMLPHDSARHANRYIDIPIATGLGIGRNVIIARTADALIAVGGKYGTLSEIAYSLQLEKPVIGIRTWDIKGIIGAEDAEDAVGRALTLLDRTQDSGNR
jgi:uncharacterized protein (TIGR00725 family)